MRKKRKEINRYDYDCDAIKTKYGIGKLYYEELLSKANHTFEKNAFNSVSITGIKNNIFYEHIEFHNVTFMNVDLSQVCFHKCSFHSCKFINMTSNKPHILTVDELSPRQGFSCCNFWSCDFTDCKLSEIFFSICLLKCVRLSNVFFQGALFQLCAFSQVTIENNSEWNSVFISSPLYMFDLQFIEDGGSKKIDSRSLITHFHFGKNFYNKDDLSWKIMKRDHYRRVAETYLGFNQILESNHRNEDRVNYYYERKCAETRSKKNPERLIGYITEITSGYGEKPFRCLAALLVLMTMYAIIYMFTGFYADGRIVIQYTFRGVHSQTPIREVLKDFIQSLYFSLFTIITVGQGTPSPFGLVTRIVSATELFLGAILITVFTGTLFRKITK